VYQFRVICLALIGQFFAAFAFFAAKIYRITRKKHKKEGNLISN